MADDDKTLDAEKAPAAVTVKAYDPLTGKDVAWLHGGVKTVNGKTVDPAVPAPAEEGGIRVTVAESGVKEQLNALSERISALEEAAGE